MNLKNRVIAKEGPRVKDGLLQHYDFSGVEFKERWLTFHSHPPRNDIASNKIIGRFTNERLVNGDLIVDMDIFDDLLTEEEMLTLRDQQDVSIGYWYESGTDDNISHPLRKVKVINHVAIGVEKGVCSYPECGLKVAATDSKETPYDTETFEGIEVLTKEKTQLNVGCDEKDATIEKLQRELSSTQETLKVAQDKLQSYESEIKSKLIEKLCKRLKLDADSFKERSLEDLIKLDQDTAHLGDKVGLVLKKKGEPQQDSEKEEDSFELTETGELPITSYEKGHDFYKGANLNG